MIVSSLGPKKSLYAYGPNPRFPFKRDGGKVAAMNGKRLSLAVLAAGIALGLVGGASAWLAAPLAQWEAIKPPDPNAVSSADPWPRRIVAGGELAAVLGVVIGAVGLNGVLRAATPRRGGS